ncbi:helix-turn-helix domain-containing protein [Clostridium sp. LBM24168]
MNSYTTFTVINSEDFALPISDSAFKIHSFLLSMCYSNKNTCFPSQKYIAEHLHKSVRTVQRGIKELKDKGLIKIKRRGSISNVYTMLRKLVINSSKAISNKIKKVQETIKKVKNSSHSSKTTSTFNNFKQRDYNFSNLEDMLLGKKEYNFDKLME